MKGSSNICVYNLATKVIFLSPLREKISLKQKFYYNRNRDYAKIYANESHAICNLNKSEHKLFFLFSFETDQPDAVIKVQQFLIVEFIDGNFGEEIANLIE